MANKSITGGTKTAVDINELTAVLDEAQTCLEVGQVEQGINGLVEQLYHIRRATSNDEYIRLSEVCLQHPICRYIHQDPYARRSFKKPRGYAGDAVLLDFFYGLNYPATDDTPLGKAIFNVSMGRSSSESVRYRRVLVAQMIDDVVSFDANAQVLSVACGHLREASLSHAVQEKKLRRFVALDQDAESIQVVTEESERNGWSVEPIRGSIRAVLTRKVNVHDAAFVYAAGLYDYLETPHATRLTARMFDMLCSGGRLLVANFTPETQERGYMEAFMDWRLLYRNESQVAEFTAEINPDDIARTQLYRDPEGNVIYLNLVKR